MPVSTSPAQRLVLNIGMAPIALHIEDPDFADLMRERYGGFVEAQGPACAEVEVRLVEAQNGDPEQEMQVVRDGRLWRLERGDLRAEFDSETNRGVIRQAANPYAIDSALRVIHTLLLSKQGGFLLHAASAIRNRKAFVFSGISGAGKTTISRLAPADVTLLTDEVSYLRPMDAGYVAFGTPFAGELARIGEPAQAPIEKLLLLAKGRENRFDRVPPPEAARLLMRNILFFARDPAAVARVFDSACDFVARVPVYVLSFYPSSEVWDLIG